MLIDLPGQPPSYEKPVSATSVEYFEWLEDNRQVLYPAFLIAVTVLIVLGVLWAVQTRQQEMSEVEKAKFKREIIRELRLNVDGLTLQALSRKVVLSEAKLSVLLDEMAGDHIVARTPEQKWRMSL